MINNMLCFLLLSLFIASLLMGHPSGITDDASFCPETNIDHPMPVRDGMIPDEDYPDAIEWDEVTTPDYTPNNNNYMLQHSNKWYLNNSLEYIVSNLVKTFEMEAVHKPNYQQWVSIDNKNIENLQTMTFSANNGKKFNISEIIDYGTYNVLLDACPESHKKYYMPKTDINNGERTTTDIYLKLSKNNSNKMFQNAFLDGFLWEVLNVFTGPPRITFSWRHWGILNGKYQNYTGNGELIELNGFGIVNVIMPNNKYKIARIRVQNIEVFYDLTTFLEEMNGVSKCPYEMEEENLDHL